MKKTTYSITKIIDIADVKNNYECYLSRSFEKNSRQTIPGNIASISGIIALKQAVCQLFLEAVGVDVDERDIIISHKKNGAPYILKIAFSRNPETTLELSENQIHVSISHTRKAACGLAAAQVIQK